jgi:para-aminobenzoate synthetase component 1
MTTLVQEVADCPSPEAIAAPLHGEPGLVLLRSAPEEDGRARYSFLCARPFQVFRSLGSRCEITARGATQVLFGDPWTVFGALAGRFESLEEVDLPFPLGGCFGWWGYDLKNAVEPRLPRRAVRDLDLPDCWLGFYDSLMAFDHALGKAWIIATGFRPDGSRSAALAKLQLDAWRRLSGAGAPPAAVKRAPRPSLESATGAVAETLAAGAAAPLAAVVRSSLPREAFLAAVSRAQRYIRAGDIYQVNLSQRLMVAAAPPPWELFENLSAISPAPYSAFINDGAMQVVSSSPELFLRLSGAHAVTRPIKGTRPRGADADADARLAFELRTSAKENAELVMITDLLRNDLGRVCQFGSVTVPDLARLERFAQVQHLVATVEGHLRPEVTHLEALRACFPGGSITGAPKVRALEIIDELEPVARGPYTGALGYLGFNRESQLSIVIRAAFCRAGQAWFHAGAGIVADSDPAAEYEETLAKAQGFLRALAVGNQASLDASVRLAGVQRSNRAAMKQLGSGL